MIEKRQFYIDGAWVNPAAPRDLDVIDPSTEEPCAVISLGDQADTDAAVAAAPLGLVGHYDDRNVRSAQPVADFAVERGQPGPCIDHEQDRIRIGNADLGLNPHPARQSAGVFIFPPGGIDDGEAHPCKLHVAESPVARDARLVVDQRELLAHQPVEQGGFAHVGAPDDDYARQHRDGSWALPAPLASALALLVDEKAKERGAKVNALLTSLLRLMERHDRQNFAV